jgi:alpha-amylase/alpha-mannosidase (GH57 family)
VYVLRDWYIVIALRQEGFALNNRSCNCYYICRFGQEDRHSRVAYRPDIINVKGPCEAGSGYFNVQKTTLRAKQARHIMSKARTDKSQRFVCIHGHFYQPPRENAWLEAIEQQESARPWHDWNARINHECYAPNAAARILDEQGQIVKIRNNYNRISFNFGPTLLSWMEENDPDAYQLIQQADVKSRERFGGHGSALAQVHSHLILPLCNYRDKVTQVHWGVRDFEHRFGRYPEGMWLAETAVNTETLEVLAGHGIGFTVLAPRQARAIRKIGTEDWKSVHAESIDTRRPYWCLLPSGRRIALYFYHGGVSQAVAFERLLNSGKGFAQRILSIHDPNDSEPQLAHIATDGESYGHHHRFGEMALADALNYIEDGQSATLTNYGEFLERFPPEWEVQIHENSSWSCVHGVERWRSNCGCNTGGANSGQQLWRKPLRDTLDWLRDELVPFYEREGARLLRDPWAARNDYMDVLLEQRSDAAMRRFWDKHVRRPLSELETTTALRLLEMQRHAVLMYTSCGWFFDEISGIETNQILQYALRTLDYAEDLGAGRLHDEFIKRLAEAPSNVHKNGAASFVHNVVPTRVTLNRVAMHFAVASLFEDDPQGLDLFNYTAAVDFFEKIEAGTPQITAGRLRIRSKLTQLERSFCFVVLYLGQQHIIGNMSEQMPPSQFGQMWTRCAAAFRSANMGEVIGVLQEHFGPDKFTLSSLFADERIKIIQEITDNGLTIAEASFRNVFNDNYQLMTGLVDAGLPIPDAWRNIAAYVLRTELVDFFNYPDTLDPRKLRRVAEDIRRWHLELTDKEAIRHAASQRIYDEINKITLHESDLLRIEWLSEVLEVMFQQLELKPSIWRSQNVFYLFTKGYRKGTLVFANPASQAAFERLAQLLKVRL